MQRARAMFARPTAAPARPSHAPAAPRLQPVARVPSMGVSSSAASPRQPLQPNAARLMQRPTRPSSEAQRHVRAPNLVLRRYLANEVRGYLIAFLVCCSSTETEGGSIGFCSTAFLTISQASTRDENEGPLQRDEVRAIIDPRGLLLLTGFFLISFSSQINGGGKVRVSIRQSEQD